MAATIDAASIPADVRRQLGIKATRKRSMTMHEVRTHAFKVCAIVAELTASERARVLRHASKLNGV